MEEEDGQEVIDVCTQHRVSFLSLSISPCVCLSLSLSFSPAWPNVDRGRRQERNQGDVENGDDEDVGRVTNVGQGGGQGGRIECRGLRGGCVGVFWCVCVSVCVYTNKAAHQTMLRTPSHSLSNNSSPVINTMSTARQYYLYLLEPFYDKTLDSSRTPSYTTPPFSGKGKDEQ